MSLKPTPCTQGHIAQWLEHPVYNWEVLGSNPSLVIVSPLGHFPIGLLRSHEFNRILAGYLLLLEPWDISCSPWLLVRQEGDQLRDPMFFLVEIDEILVH